MITSTRVLTIVATIALGFPLYSNGQDSLEDQMSADDFRRAGLHKLDANELDALNDWLDGRQAAATAAATATLPTTRTDRFEKPEPIESTLTGDFDGWDGATVFRLANGQLWKQRIDGSYRYDGSAPVEVRIEKNFFGFYKLTVKSTGRSVGVTRIQ
jgi:hypothetical protein